MRTNPFVDAWLFLTGNTGEHRSSGVGWLLTALFLALLAVSVWIAWMNWRQDAAQRTKEHVATWFMRVMIGVMFYQGSIWKLPFPVAGGCDRKVVRPQRRAIRLAQCRDARG